MSNVSKRRREGSRPKIKTMGDHKEFLKRITKTLYYGQLPTLPCLSLPVTEISCALWSATQRGRSLRRLHVDAAARVARGACVSPCALVLALLYLERLRAARPHYLHTAAPHDLFLISLMVGNKFLQDDGEDDEVISSEWAASGGMDIKQLNKLELEFLDAIDWNVFVNEDSFEAGLSWLERQVAIKQARARGFFTYTDLRAACPAALGAQLAGALAAACLALVAAAAALLAAALALSAACHSALAPTPHHTPEHASLSPVTVYSTFVNNSTMDIAIDALADSLEARERATWCAEWARFSRDSDAAPRHAETSSQWWARGAALTGLYWSAAVRGPLQRWLERLAEYAELARGALHASRPAAPPQPPRRCRSRWTDLSKLGALLVTVSDR